MNRHDFNIFCGELHAARHVVQWGNADVWKVGGKVFAICGWNDGRDAYTFKASDIAFEVLQGAPGIRPAPYLASRGLKWLQVHDDPGLSTPGLSTPGLPTPGLSDDSLKEHIVASYDMVVAKLTKKARAELGLKGTQ